MEMFNLEVPAATINVESRGVVVPVNVAAIPHDVLRQVILHGIKQKVADAASGAALAVWKNVKGDDAPKPSRDQLADFVVAHDAAIKEVTRAMMQKAADALLEGRWMIREAGGTVTRWTEEQTIALDLAKSALTAIFTAALAKASPNAKPTAANFVAMSEKVAAFFKQNEKRPTWDDKAVMAWIDKQASNGGRDFMAEARAELARRAAAVEEMGESLDEMLADI